MTEEIGTDPDSGGMASRTVFVSYASQDADVANTACRFLEERGIRCWIAPRDVAPGSLYADAIVRAINESSTLLLVLSQSAVASSHVGREIERAASKCKRIITFRVDSAALSPELEYFLSNCQWIDVAAFGMPAALAKLAEAVGSAPSNPPGIVVLDKSATRTTGSSRKYIAVVLVVVVLGVSVAVGARFWLSRAGVTSAAAVRLPTTAAISDKSIAVLPFTDMSQKKDQEYFGDGMAEEIIDLLAKIPDLTVIGRTSSFQFKGKNEDLRTIGTALNAAYLLEGSVRNSGDQVRITAQLINAETGSHEWSETYDRPIGDVLKLQDAIAAAVAREMQLTVAPTPSAARSRLVNADAYDLYLRGRHRFEHYDAQGLNDAASLFTQALERDPTFADAAAWVAWTYDLQGEFAFVAPATAFEKARGAAEAALKLDPHNAEGHFVLAEIHIVYDWDWSAAERELQKGTGDAPAHVDGLYVEEQLSFVRGTWGDGITQIHAALAEDPLDPGSFFRLAQFQLCRGRLPEAEAAMRRALDIRPTYSYGHYYLGLIMLARGDREGALRAMEQEVADDGKSQGLAILYVALGRKQEADRELAGMLRNQASVNAVGIADVYAARGQSDEAMQWLERAYAQKDAELYFIKSETELKNLSGDPRFKELLKKMNLPE